MVAGHNRTYQRRMETCPVCGEQKPHTRFKRDGKNHYAIVACSDCARRAVEANGKQCGTCKEIKPASQFHELSRSADGLVADCKECMRVRGRESHMRRVYGVSQEEYDALFAAQGGVCAICGLPGRVIISGFGRRKRAPRVYTPLQVDHDHETGKVRGLLCNECNTGIGRFGDSVAMLRMAILYLERHVGADQK